MSPFTAPLIMTPGQSVFSKFTTFRARGARSMKKSARSFPEITDTLIFKREIHSFFPRYIIGSDEGKKVLNARFIRCARLFS
jgi:hypothetical protein